jgi:virulence factor Mce-like protein
MRRSRQPELFANPVLIGAITVLVSAVGLMLAYNANNGLPFVPTYNIRAMVPDAAELTPGNEVRVGGKRVGVISGITAEPGPGGVPAAALSLKLEKAVEPLAADTKVTVRPRSTLGLKYLQLQPGHARKKVPSDGVLPLARAQPIVELDEVLNVFDRETRAGVQGTVRELGDALAGRGQDVNDTVAALPALLSRLEPVARNLRSARTDLHGFIAGVSAAANAVAPVAGQLGSLFDNAAVTLAAVDAAGGALEQGIAETPPTETVATRAAMTVRPVLADAAALARDAAPGVALLPRASRRVAGAVEVGTPVLRRATGLADRLGDSLHALDDLVRDPATDGSVRRLTDVVGSLAPTLRFLNPFQVRCNYLGLWTRNASSAVSEGDANGTWFRFMPIAQTPEILQSATPAPELHANVYPHTGQNGECEAGNEPYLPGQRIGNVPGQQAGSTELTGPPPRVGR